MATFEIKMPKLGESVTEGTIISWSVKIGDQVNEDDVLFEVSTAKVSAEIPSPVAGKVFKILFNEGDTVTVGTTVAIIQLEGSEEEIPDNSTTLQEEADSTTSASVVAAKEEERWYSPVVLQMAQEANLSKEEMDHIPGTGYMGRLSKKDMKDYLSGKKSATIQQQVQSTVQAMLESNGRICPASRVTSARLLLSLPLRHQRPAKTRSSKWIVYVVLSQTTWCYPRRFPHMLLQLWK